MSHVPWGLNDLSADGLVCYGCSASDRESQLAAGSQTECTNCERYTAPGSGRSLPIIVETVQVECYTTVDAPQVSLPVVQGLGCEHTHPQPSGLWVVVGAQPQCSPLVEVDGVLTLQQVRRCGPPASAFTSTEGGRGRAAHVAALHVGAETLLTLACVSWVMERRREAERDSRGEAKGDDSAEEQVSLSPPLK
ncbi:hypothetical protein EYF80_011655 [Liparis tanakae]|uniref:Uncharacterized protein n=1 Tax=Liparis tanakae TaxID=230148 RepID=A0A4Z2IJF8_9TELE|nr:hypothetical protein EYF80_011655 [Liparis tanakae]